MTPTLLAGDRSLSNVVAHEIAHSWFGNFVTSENWESFWMNEGFTVFLERKICKSLQPTPEQARAHHGLHAQIGLNDLQKSVDRYGADNPHTCLCPRLHGIVRTTLLGSWRNKNREDCYIVFLTRFSSIFSSLALPGCVLGS